MKNISLIFLLCFSIGLQGFPINPAPAQNYANSAKAKMTADFNILASDYELLSNLVSSMESTLCGIDANTGGLNIQTNGAGTSSPSYSYTNCNGGAMASYNSWASQISFWADTISNIGDHWEDGYDACAVSYTGASGYDTNFYADLASSTVVNDISNVNAALNSIYGCTPNNNPTTPYSASNPNPCPVVMPNNYQNAQNLVQNMLNALDDLTNLIDITGLSEKASAVTNANAAFNTAISNFNNCKNSQNNCASCPCCFAEFDLAMKAFENQNSLTLDLFETLLTYFPYQGSVSTVIQFGGSLNGGSCGPVSCYDNFISCINPGRCNSAGTNCTGYEFATVNFDEGGAVAQANNYATNINNVSNDYLNKIQAMQVRLGALTGQLNIFTNGVQKVYKQMNDTQNTCQTDIKNYQAEVAATMDVLNFIISNVIGIGLIEFTGGLGVFGLSQLVMVLMAIPQVNQATVGAMSQFLSQQIASGIHQH